MINSIQNSIALTILLIIVVVAMVLVTIIVVIPKQIQKGTNVAGTLVIAQNALDKSNAVIQVLDKIVPNNTAINILKTIETYAQKGVSGAEQLYKSSQLSADARLSTANATVVAALNVLNVPVSPELQKVIDGAIQAEVLILPKINLTDVQIQAEKAKLQATNAQLVAQNTQLEQSIKQLKSAVSSIQ